MITAMNDFVADLPDRETLRQMIAGAIAELDLRQIAITRRLTPAQRCQEGLSMIRVAEDAGAYRLRKRRPELSQAEALRIVRSAQSW